MGMLSNDLRPVSLDDIIGQDTIVKAIRNYLKSNDLPQVMYLVGNSGSGKTSLAYVITSILQCENPKKDSQDCLAPCGVCSHCKDIQEERFNLGTYCYNGAEMKADDIVALSESLLYSETTARNRVIIINEAQRVSSLNKLLEIIEAKRKNTYFILTSTDTSKFKSTSNKDNKSQETKALRGRGVYWNVKPINEKLISDFLFKQLSIDDPKEEIPDSFMTEVLPIIAENSKGSLRQAINDYKNCIMAETYTQKEVIDLLGYEDEKEYHSILYYLLKKEVKGLELIQELEEHESFFNYSWTILTNASFRKLIGKPLDTEWKEKNFITYDTTGNIENLLGVYNETNKMCNGYFNTKVFYTNLYYYMKDNVPKLVKKVVKTLKD